MTYQLRYGEASEDLNAKERDFNAVRERGRWRYLYKKVCQNREVAEAPPRPPGEDEAGVVQEDRAGDAANHPKAGGRNHAMNNGSPGQSWRSPGSPIFLEVFSGVGGLTSSLQALGRNAFGIDMEHGKDEDVLDPLVKAAIFRLIRTGMVLFVGLGMPCAMFSVARKHDGLGPPPLRNDSRPRGSPNLQGNQLSQHCLTFPLSSLKNVRVANFSGHWKI